MALDSGHSMVAGERPAEASLAAAWADLAGRALSPAARNHPDFVFPLLKAVPSARILVAGTGSQLHLAFPARPLLRPLPLWASLVTPLSNGGLPHADRTEGAAALAALLDHLRQPLVFHAIPATGPFWDVLQRGSLRLAVLRRWQRGGLKVEGTFADWLERALDSKRRRELRRQRARLAEQGDLRSEALAAGADVTPWIDSLLALEAAGWKGERGTALSQQRGFAEALRGIAEAMHRRGGLRFWRLIFNGQTIATLFAVAERGEVWLGKIAHDPAFERSSPGVQVILDATEALFAEGGLRLADSCAIPNHPMIDRIWRDRLPMADVMVAAPAVSAAQFSATVASEKFRNAVRSGVRDTLVRYAGWKRS